MEVATGAAPGAAAAAADLRAVVRAAERLVAAVEARALALTTRLGLTMPQLRAVLALRRLGRANGRQLATALGLTPGAIVAICDHLEARGYVRRVADTRDRRVTWVELTDAGAAALRTTPATALAKARTKAAIAGLTDQERAGFVALADAFAEALEATVEAAELLAVDPASATPRREAP